MQDPKDNQEVVTPETGGPEIPAEAERNGPGVEPEVVPGPEEALRRAELLAQEHHDAWLRARAEADNIRKRAQAEVENARKFGIEGFAESLLPVKDSLDAALAAQNNTVEALRSGVELTIKQLVAAFARHNVYEIDPVGQKFDPHRHQAMSMVDSDEAPNTVVQVFQKGYLLHDRVIRPALVAVAKPREG